MGFSSKVATTVVLSALSLVYLVLFATQGGIIYPLTRKNQINIVDRFKDGHGERIDAVNNDKDVTFGRVLNQSGSEDVRGRPPLPNQDSKGNGFSPSSGPESPDYGKLQEERIRWLMERAKEIKGGGGRDGKDMKHSGEERDRNLLYSVKDRVETLEKGADMWGGTYVPPIGKEEKQRLVDSWTAGGEEKGGRILYVITSFDRGNRLGRKFRSVDKLDFVLMMLDEMREACELGFSPQVHFIAAWPAQDIIDLVNDRLYCQQTKALVPYSVETHLPKLGGALSIKHRAYMKDRLEDFDVFVQVEDDMILTLNHILLYLEASLVLRDRDRDGGHGMKYKYMPGFIRVEPPMDSKNKYGVVGSGRADVWFEWEILLSRFRPIKIKGSGVYMGLGGSKVLPRGGNNQGMWMATQGQLRHLDDACQYLKKFNNESAAGHVETHSGSLEMFNICGVTKVFPAANFADFLVHHRTNNKCGARGESRPAVPVSAIYSWVGQFLRDEPFLLPQARRGA